MLRIYQVDAFHPEPLRGNPAAIIPLDRWLADELLQAVARENNLSETAFFLPETDGAIPLRWFTPNKEVRLCGHATLATAHVLFREIGLRHRRVQFSTLSGRLSVERLERGYRLDFPADRAPAVAVPDGLASALGTNVAATFAGRDDLLAVVKDEATLAALRPDFRALRAIGGRGVVVTAPGDEVDFVSRCFYPNFGIDEDPVTGSAHTLLTPYWAERLGKDTLNAHQISERGGILRCTLAGDRVWLAGEANTYLRGQIYLK